MVAEEHRDEFRAVAQYLNELAELDPSKGIVVWLVEAKAVRIAGSPWAPLFTAVVEPNRFTATVEEAKQRQARTVAPEEFWAQFDDPAPMEATKALIAAWEHRGRKWRLGPDHAVLMAAGPAASGLHSVIRVYSDGSVAVPFGAYRGKNTGLPIAALTSTEFIEQTKTMFGLVQQQQRTAPGWLRTEHVDEVLTFCDRVAEALDAARQPASI